VISEPVETEAFLSEEENEIAIETMLEDIPNPEVPLEENAEIVRKAGFESRFVAQRIENAYWERSDGTA
jgi:hypothetical protein